MALMMGSLYEALKESGTSDTRAKAAAEEVAEYEGRFAQVAADMADVKSTLRLHSWILTFKSAIMVGVLFRVFWP